MKEAYGSAGKISEESVKEIEEIWRRIQNETDTADWKIQWTEDALYIENDKVFYTFSRKNCLMQEAGVIEKQAEEC